MAPVQNSVRELIQPYEFHVVQIPGTQNMADPLSRLTHGKTGLAKHKHEAEQYVHFVAINATPRAMLVRWRRHQPQTVN